MDTLGHSIVPIIQDVFLLFYLPIENNNIIIVLIIES